MNRRICVLITLCFFAAQPLLAGGVRTNLAAIEKHFLEGDYNTVISETDSLISAGYGKKDELYYFKGMSELKTNRFSAARQSFDYIINKCSWSSKVFEANLGIGDSYLLEGNNAKALSAYNDMADKYGSNKNISIVYGRLSLCHSKMGVGSKAASYHDMVKDKAPLSFEARSAAPIAEHNQLGPAKRITYTAGQDKGKCYVQVGSFKDKRNADRLARKLVSQGYESRISIPTSSDDDFYRVKVGSFSSKSDAQALASKLRANGYRTKVCTDNACE